MKKRILVLFSLLALTFTSLFGSAAGQDITQAAKKKTKLSIRLNKKKLNLTTGSKSYKLKAKVKPAKAKVSWKSSKPKVASVSAKGKIKVKKAGVTTITATARYKKMKKKATCKVTIKNTKDESSVVSPSPDTATSSPAPSATAKNTVKIQQITVEKDACQITAGQTLSLNVSVLPAGASTEDLVYTCDNPSVATVNEKGQIQALKEGTVNIKISAAGDPQITKLIQVTVISPITKIEPENEIVEMKLGDTYTLAPKITSESATLLSCNIENSKDYVASIEADGKVTAKYPGITVVTIFSAADPNVSCKFRIRVTDDYDPEEGFDKEDSAIPHGELKDIRYSSDYRSQNIGKARIWLPPDYDRSKQYNLLFCLHGGRDDERYWTKDAGGTNDGCSADHVLDNAYAKGLIEDTVVVFPSGVIEYDETKDYPNIVKNPLLTSFWEDHYLLEFDIINCLLPFIKKNYSIMEGPEHMGICGLSMGCAQTMEIAFKNPDLFQYVGCYSAGPFEGTDQPFVRSGEDAEKLNSKFKLVFFITGEEDHMMDDSMRNFIKNCDNYGLNNIFYEVPGRGHDDPCWDRALYAFMKYAFK